MIQAGPGDHGVHEGDRVGVRVMPCDKVRTDRAAQKVEEGP